ncbi:MAG: D-alanine--D-alanine ligase [Deferribacteraceae bacterium]|jgi:D-alanine-D-alanine ligase|nr:D-alanine--D-alanine ligase [Deferribacteraceae bacterium]
MRIGFTYDLKDDYLAAGFSEEEAAEFDSALTIDAVSDAITACGHELIRIGGHIPLMQALLKGERWDMVFNICEGVSGSARESLVPALLDAFNIPYFFSSPALHAITLNKAVTKHILRDFSISTTDFCLADSTQGIAEPADYPLFVKPAAEGTGRGVTPNSIVKNREELIKEVDYLIRCYRAPVIIEPYLSGREATVGILGSGEEAFPIGVLEIEITQRGDSPIHSYYNKANCESCVRYTLAEGEFATECAQLALTAHRLLGIDDASRVDIRADKFGRAYIMEINSLPGLMPRHSDLIILGELAGYSHRRIVELILESGIRRKDANSALL